MKNDLCELKKKCGKLFSSLIDHNQIFIFTSWPERIQRQAVHQTPAERRPRQLHPF
jgi:hypothetical protein